MEKWKKVQMGQKHAKIVPVSFTIREMQIKTHLNTIFIYQMGEIQKIWYHMCWRGCVETGTRILCSWEGCELMEASWRWISQHTLFGPAILF